jgi:hypothetical protein
MFLALSLLLALACLGPAAAKLAGARPSGSLRHTSRSRGTGTG